MFYQNQNIIKKFVFKISEIVWKETGCKKLLGHHLTQKSSTIFILDFIESS